MEKKAYIKPEMEAMAIEVQSQMMTVSAPQIDIVKPGEEGGEGGTEILSNNRRGTWGNLWD